MKVVIDNVRTLLSTISELKYVDENTGQLDNYSPNFPVKWPCALIDIQSDIYTNKGRNPTKSPVNRQMSNFVLEIRIANLKLTNTSSRAPITQRDQAESIWTIIDAVHEKIQGYSPDPTISSFIRTARNRVMRDDGVQVYVITYTAENSDC